MNAYQWAAVAALVVVLIVLALTFLPQPRFISNGRGVPPAPLPPEMKPAKAIEPQPWPHDQPPGSTVVMPTPTPPPTKKRATRSRRGSRPSRKK